MKQEELDNLVQRAKSARGTPVTPDFDDLWERIKRDRARHPTAESVLRRSPALLAAAVILVMLAGVATIYVALPFLTKPASFAESEPVRMHLSQTQNVIQAFRANAASEQWDPALAALAGDLALVSGRLRVIALEEDSALAGHLRDTDFALSQIASYEAADDDDLSNLALIEYALRARATEEAERTPAPSDSVDAGPSPLLFMGRRALAERNYPRAEALLRQAASGGDAPEIAGRARYWLAYTLYERGVEERDVRVLSTARAEMDVYQQPRTDPAALADEGIVLKERIRVELATLGDSSAARELGGMLHAFRGAPQRSYELVLVALEDTGASLVLGQQSLFALAAGGGVAAARALKEVAEGRRRLPQALRLASVRALAVRQLADEPYFEKLSNGIEEPTLRREVVSAFQAARQTLQPVARTAIAPRQPRALALTPAHAEPVFQLRTVVSAAQLGNVDVSSIVADDAGSVFLADRRSRQVIAFDSAGTRILTIGAHGANRAGGQNSFRSVGALGWLADTLVVADDSTNEIFFFSRSGELLARRAGPIGIGSIGALYGAGAQLFGVGLVRGATGIRRHYFHVSARGMPNVLTSLRDSASDVSALRCVEATRGVVHTVQAPFPPSGPLRAFTGQGELIIAMRDNPDLAPLMVQSLELRLFDALSGRSAGSFTAPFEKAALTTEVWLNEMAPVAALQERVGTLNCTPPLTRPITEPALYSILTDERGRAWLEVKGARGRQLLILDASLGTLESVAMPARDYGAAPAVRGNAIYFLSRDDRGRAGVSSYSRRR